MGKYVNELHREAMEAYKSLDFFQAYRLIIDSLEADSGPQICILKHLCQVIGFSSPEQLQEDRVMRILERDISRKFHSPWTFSVRSMLHKVFRRWEKARDDAFIAVMTNLKAGDEKNHHRYLFELAYLWKNQGRPDLFTPMALSIPWNQLLYRSCRMVALPREILKQYTLTVDFNSPPVRAVKEAEEMGRSFHLLRSMGNIRSGQGFIRHAKLLEEKKIPFVLGFMLPPAVASDPVVRKLGSLDGAIPQNPGNCPFSGVIDGYTLRICPRIKSTVSPVTGKIQDFWDLEVDSDPPCRCWS